jgi:hypothetical protein
MGGLRLARHFESAVCRSQQNLPSAIEFNTLKSYTALAADYLHQLLGDEPLTEKAVSMSRVLAAPLRLWWTSHRAAASAALKTVIHASFGRPPQALFRDAERSNTLARGRALPGRTE